MPADEPPPFGWLNGNVKKWQIGRYPEFCRWCNTAHRAAKARSGHIVWLCPRCDRRPT